MRTRLRSYDLIRIRHSLLKDIFSRNDYETVSISDRGLTFDIIHVGDEVQIQPRYGSAQTIPIHYSPCGYGRRRLWTCACGKHAQDLYFYRNSWQCRSCVRLTYDCQNGYEPEYVGNKIRELRDKIWTHDTGGDNWDLTLPSSWRRKPKGMWTSTYRQKLARLQFLEYRYSHTLPNKFSALLSY